jgi:hypothetical protein
VWKGDLTTHRIDADSAPAQRINELQQLVQAAQGNLRITLQHRAPGRPVGIRPAPRELYRRAISKAYDHRDLARGGYLEGATD